MGHDVLYRSRRGALGGRGERMRGSNTFHEAGSGESKRPPLAMVSGCY